MNPDRGYKKFLVNANRNWPEEVFKIIRKVDGDLAKAPIEAAVVFCATEKEAEVWGNFVSAGKLIHLRTSVNTGEGTTDRNVHCLIYEGERNSISGNETFFDCLQ